MFLPPRAGGIGTGKWEKQAGESIDPTIFSVCLTWSVLSACLFTVHSVDRLSQLCPFGELAGPQCKQLLEMDHIDIWPLFSLDSFPI